MQRNYSIDFIKTVAILAVVVIHVSSTFLRLVDVDSFQFYAVAIVNQFGRFAVPLFFIVSGFLLASRYNSDLSVVEFYKKRVVRILPSYIIWSAIYFLVLYHNSISELFTTRFFQLLINGKASYQFYFIPAIIILYAAFPFFMRYKKILFNTSIIIATFILSTFLLYAAYYYTYKPPVPYPFQNALFNTFPFLAGMLAAMHFPKIKKALTTITAPLTLFIISGIIVALEGIAYFKNTGNLRFINDQWRPSVMIYAMFTGLFLDVFYNKFLTNFSKQVLFLSKYSFGVFFIHAAILTYIMDYLNMIKVYNVATFSGVTALTLVLSYVVIYLLSKIPAIGKTLSAS